LDDLTPKPLKDKCFLSWQMCGFFLRKGCQPALGNRTIPQDGER